MGNCSAMDCCPLEITIPTKDIYSASSILHEVKERGRGGGGLRAGLFGTIKIMIPESLLDPETTAWECGKEGKGKESCVGT